MHALGLEFGSAAQLFKRPGSVWNCLWGNALKRSPGIIRKSRVSYPGPGFLSSATWPSLPQKHYNVLNLNHDARLTQCHTTTFELKYGGHGTSSCKIVEVNPIVMLFPIALSLNIKYQDILSTLEGKSLFGR